MSSHIESTFRSLCHINPLLVATHHGYLLAPSAMSAIRQPVVWQKRIYPIKLPRSSGNTTLLIYIAIWPVTVAFTHLEVLVGRPRVSETLLTAVHSSISLRNYKSPGKYQCGALKLSENTVWKWWTLQARNRHHYNYVIIQNLWAIVS